MPSHKIHMHIPKKSKWKIKISIFYKVVSKNEINNIANNCIEYILKYIVEKFKGEDMNLNLKNY